MHELSEVEDCTLQKLRQQINVMKVEGEAEAEAEAEVEAEAEARAEDVVTRHKDTALPRLNLQDKTALALAVTAEESGTPSLNAPNSCGSDDVGGGSDGKEAVLIEAAETAAGTNSRSGGGSSNGQSLINNGYARIAGAPSSDAMPGTRGSVQMPSAEGSVQSGPESAAWETDESSRELRMAVAFLESINEMTAKAHTNMCVRVHSNTPSQGSGYFTGILLVPPLRTW